MNGTNYSLKIKNRGLSGDETAGVLDRLDEVLESKPKQIFLMIGVNDLRHGIPTETIIKNYKEIVKKIIKVSPSTELIIQSVLPVNNKIKDAKTNNETVIRLNNEIKKISNKNNLLYVDLFKRLIDQEGNLRKEYSSDGLHINGEAYLIWKEAIKGYVKI
ncbi:MAG: GDSL-type esterase/lipase family protein [Ignavibacteriaceae bacterium]